MVRKLKFHEQKLLKKVDFISWEIDNNLQESKVIRRYHLKGREEYTAYNKLSRQVRELALKIKELDPKDAYRISCSARLLTKLYDMAVIATKQNLELCSKVSASAFCRRRLAVVMVRLKMAENIKVASQYVQQVSGAQSIKNVLTNQGHVRVGPTLVTDPAFLVSRTLEDFITWTNTSKIRKHIANYESTRDDYDLMD